VENQDSREGEGKACELVPHERDRLPRPHLEEVAVSPEALGLRGRWASLARRLVIPRAHLS
jgi:hypothetical protein